MREERIRALIAVGKGFGLAAAVTAAGILLLGAAIVLWALSDKALTILNQCVKVISVVLGAVWAVRSYGKRGFALGGVVGLLYMTLGCAMYYGLAGGSFTPATLAAEFAMGGVIGALAGSLAANYLAAKRA